MKGNFKKRYHFLAFWKNGDKMSICSYGKNKKDAYIKLLQARKSNKFKYRQGDGFTVTYKTQEENYTKLRNKGLSRSEANMLSLHGHTSYVVKDNKVYFN